MSACRGWSGVSLALLSAALSLVGAGPTFAGGPVAFERSETRPSAATSGAELAVASTAIAQNGAMAMDQSGYGRNISPPLSWSAGPPGVRSYALIVEDPDAPGPEAAVHWLVWNLPAGSRSLGRGLRNVDRPKSPEGAVQGLNDHASLGYSGPRPPVGDPAHHYHFQLFALDRPLGLRPGSDRNALLRAVRGHVLARGELVGTYAQPTPRPFRRERGAT